MKGERAKCVTDLEEVKAEAEAQKRKKEVEAQKCKKTKVVSDASKRQEKRLKPLLQILSIVKWALNFQWNY